ncbi:carbohydrate ABC transporter permease [Paenibacillus psychroresistens]|uniref:Carbohydrate ABC transporter permease n=1 Tax=Paenibacillus psychroresistens TaxID=1778678 RepID=A0A6B8RP89_9BACL|nr:carbohydrate ABC transporter permease [Paenibacillus psychroresistens]QGQ97624.1 carbohydrate ABC transporter permease [Paenibacillus psychroresistens]
MNKIRPLPRIALSLLVAALAVIIVIPLVLTITNSLMTPNEMSMNYGLIGKMTDAASNNKDAFVNLKVIPDWVTFAQYKKLLITTPRFLKMFWNSVGLVFPIIAGQTLIASLAAYAFAKLRFKGRELMFLIYLMTMLMPFQVTLVPNYIIIDGLGLLNTSAAIILPGVFGAFGVFMLRQFMTQIPSAYMEAAKMDGAGHAVIFIRVILPLVKPGLAALTVLLFVDYWNMVEQPLIFLEDEFKQPLSLYLLQINQQEPDVVFAASVLYMSPMVLLFLHAETYLIEGIQHSGIKG